VYVAGDALQGLFESSLREEIRFRLRQRRCAASGRGTSFCASSEVPQLDEFSNAEDAAQTGRLTHPFL
jgi:hypothetical protein